MRQLPRRTILRGLGATVALPFLDAMTPAFAATQASPVRTVFVYAPTGMEMQYWSPSAVGRNVDFPRILKPLEPFKDDVLVISGLADNNGRAFGDGAGDHARAIASYLTGVHPKKTEGADIRCGVSVDQILADRMGAETRFPSLQLACEDSRQIGACDSYSCVYQNIAWRSETQALVPEVNPRLIFQRLFGGSNPGESSTERTNRKADERSILDFVLDETNSLKGTLGPTDRSKFDEYLQSIREIEGRLARADRENIEAPPDLRQPAGIPLVYADYARLVFDLLLAALQTDATRVASFMLAREGGLKSYPEIGVPEAHHSISHHRNRPDLVEKCAKINCYHMEQFAYFVDRMKRTHDGDGSLLDHSVLVYGSALANPNNHEHANLPTLIAGRARGRISPGRHLRFEGETPLSNLWASLLDVSGVPIGKFGDSDGKLEQLSGL